MGGNSSSLHIQTKTWKKSFSHENYANNFDRNLALASYQNNEYLSLGKINPEIFQQQFNNEFVLKKTDDFYDAYRQKYSDDPNCCLIINTYFTDKDFKIHSCNPDVHTFNSNICDNVLYNICLKEDHFKCKTWIRSVVEHKKIQYFNDILNFIKKEENRNLEITEVFINALYDFANDKNDYLSIIDSIINSYSDDIKFKEYQCSFSSNEILKLEKEIGTNKECWYKECVLSPTYKLLTKNYYNKSQCHITICDINIKNLNISNNKIEIICVNNNKMGNNVLPLVDFIKKDKQNIIFIPTYFNTILPVLFTLSLLFIYVK